MTSRLDPLLRPSTIALIGASAKAGKIGNAVLTNLLAGDRRVYLVNPNENEILGRKCYDSVEDVPDVVDMAIIVLPASVCVSAARECVAKGIRAVIVSASGFSETGDAGFQLERELLDAIRGSETRILGPNAMGVFVPSISLDTLFIPKDRSRRPCPGTVAMISQSGAVAVSFMEKAAASGLGISACVCVGNKCDIDEMDLMQYFEEDSNTNCIAMYLESFSNGRRFIELSKKMSSSTPIVLIKSGGTPAGARAARSHTGVISTSSDVVVDGALRQAGVTRAREEEDLVDLCRAFSVIDHLRGGRICIVASAGGFGVIASDLVESDETGPSLSMAVPSEETSSALRSVVPEFTSVQNPIDLTAGVTDEMYDEVLAILQTDPGIDAILMSLELQPPNVTRQLIEIAGRRSAGPKSIVASVFAGDQALALTEAASAGLPAFPTIRRSVRALNALAERGMHLSR